MEMSPSRDVVAGIAAYQLLMPIPRLLRFSMSGKNEAYYTLWELVVTSVCNIIGRLQK
jgi:hypothetical protein